MDAGDVGACVSIGALAVVIACFITWSATDAAWKHEAVVAGHAEYVARPDGHIPDWQWKAVKP